MKKDSAASSYVKIIVKNMVVDVRIGLHAHERENDRTQRVIVNVELFTDPKGYLDNPQPDTIIDYDYIYNAITAWAQKPHVLLIETYLGELVDLCFEHSKVEAARVSITKPDIFEEVEQVGVEVYASRADWQNR
ncbi:MAG: dihydroneopterin aldolase [Bdellovibrionales bacterium]